MKLLFVYNADSGVLSSLKDTVHKAVSPNTYQCNLCKVTFGPVSMKDEWKAFIESLPYDVAFLHRDEFHRQYQKQKDVELPAVFADSDVGLTLLIPHTEINKAQSVKELIETVRHFLQK